MLRLHGERVQSVVLLHRRVEQRPADERRRLRACYRFLWDGCIHRQCLWDGCTRLTGLQALRTGPVLLGGYMLPDGWLRGHQADCRHPDGWLQKRRAGCMLPDG